MSNDTWIQKELERIRILSDKKEQERLYKLKIFCNMQG